MPKGEFDQNKKLTVRTEVSCKDWKDINVLFHPPFSLSHAPSLSVKILLFFQFALPSHLSDSVNLSSPRAKYFQLLFVGHMSCFYSSYPYSISSSSPSPNFSPSPLLLFLPPLHHYRFVRVFFFSSAKKVFRKLLVFPPDAAEILTQRNSSLPSSEAVVFLHWIPNCTQLTRLKDSLKGDGVIKRPFLLLDPKEPLLAPNPSQPSHCLLTVHSFT